MHKETQGGDAVAFLNGRFVPAAQATVPVYDRGFVQGVTVAEQLRTFNGQLFRPEAHVDRLLHSLEIVGLPIEMTAEQLVRAARELAERNYRLVAPGSDLGLAMFVTPGAYPAMVRNVSAEPTICLHTFPLRFDLWAHKFAEGESLATTEIEQVSPRCWPPELKCRSRMHYYLADRDAGRRFPGSRALMRDEDGFITETTTSNIVLYDARRGLATPPAEKILPGISLAALVELADRMDVAVEERELTADDVAAADEVYLTSTSICTLSVTRLNGKPRGSGKPGPMYERFMAAWNALVGLDIAEQARRFARPDV